jgi:hypothetical protein
MNLIIRPGDPRKFRDIDNVELMHPPSNFPFRRILDYHAKLSYHKAINKGWLPSGSTFENFFDMSIGGSIPDLNIYQNLFPSDDSENYISDDA